MAKTRTSGAAATNPAAGASTRGSYASVRREAIQARNEYDRAYDEFKRHRASSMVKDVSKLSAGDRVSIGGGGKFPVLYSGDVVSVGRKMVKIKTRSSMYGDQVISLPKDLYKAHFPSSAVPKLEAEFSRVEKLQKKYLDSAKKN
jgi:hypothetical protein